MSAPRELPLLMTAPLVRATLDLLKTQTRRVVLPQPVGWMEAEPGDVVWHRGELCRVSESRGRNEAATGNLNARPLPCPYGGPGDLLYVRETWSVHRAFDADRPSALTGSETVRYLASGERWEGAKLRPSIFMPKWASRLWLRVLEVRVQRVQDITEEDAIAEGVLGLVPSENRGEGLTPAALALASAGAVAAMSRATRREFLASTLAASLGFLADRARPWRVAEGAFRRAPTPVEAFRILWDSINAPRGYGWDTNPWVWAITYEKTEAP